MMATSAPTGRPIDEMKLSTKDGKVSPGFEKNAPWRALTIRRSTDRPALKWLGTETGTGWRGHRGTALEHVGLANRPAFRVSAHGLASQPEGSVRVQTVSTFLHWVKRTESTLRRHPPEG